MSRRIIEGQGLSNALDRGYRDWTFGDPLNKIDLSALDAIIEAATRYEQLLLSGPSEDMIERAAQQIHAWTNGNKLPWASDTDQQAYRDAAEAALLAALWGDDE